MKLSLFIGSSAMSLLLCFSQLAFAGNAVVLQGKVEGATGYLARAGWTDCQVKVSSQSEDGLIVDFALLNANSGAKMELQNLALTKSGRVGFLEKMNYDFGARTAPQPINDPGIIPQAYVQYNSLIKVKNDGNVIEYHFSELRSNGEFYGATSELVCTAH